MSEIINIHTGLSNKPPKNEQIKQHLKNLQSDLERESSILKAHLLKDHIFSIAMMCKEQKWHISGMHLCAASDHLERMLENDQIEQLMDET